MASRKKKPKRPRYPHAIERDYAKQLLRLVDALRVPVRRALVKLKQVDRAAGRLDAEGTIPERNAAEVTRSLRGLKAQFDTIVKRARIGLIAQGVEKRTNAFSTKAVDDVIKPLIGGGGKARGVVTIPTTKITEGVNSKAIIKENVDLIRSIPDRLFPEVRRVVEEGWSKGRTVDDLADDVEKRFGVSESRARLIARDQIGKINAKVTEARHKEIGIEKFTWGTAGDERVRGNPAGLYPKARPSHWEREGKVFRYDDPPEGGNPGEDFQCRCVALPVIPDLDEDE